MTGAPLAGALDAARAFVTRREGEQEVGIVAFNGDVRVVQAADQRRLRPCAARSHGRRSSATARASTTPSTHRSRSSRGRGSPAARSCSSPTAPTSAARRASTPRSRRPARGTSASSPSGSARARSTRPRSGSSRGRPAARSRRRRRPSGWPPSTTRSAAGSRASTSSATAPTRHRARRSTSPIGFDGLGAATTTYVAPTPAGLQPYHRSSWSRFVASPAAPFVLALLIAGLAALAVIGFARPRRSTLVERVGRLRGRPRPSGTDADRGDRRRSAPRRQGTTLLRTLERRLEIARIDMPASRLVLLTAAATTVAVLVLWAISPIFALLGLLTPLITRGWVAKKLRGVRDLFADQLAPNLQVLASALRTGHSFIGALTVVVDNAHEPSRSELRRVIADEQLGVPIDEALMRVAERMKSRDLEQVALLAELQRTAGGNAAEVLDTVVETLRDRADLRRLVRTLTAQGRMARWILSALPICRRARPRRPAAGRDHAPDPDRHRPGDARRRRGHGRHGLVRHPEDRRHQGLGGVHVHPASARTHAHRSGLRPLGPGARVRRPAAPGDVRPDHHLRLLASA